jgi:hypothetical protein
MNVGLIDVSAGPLIPNDSGPAPVPVGEELATDTEAFSGFTKAAEGINAVSVVELTYDVLIDTGGRPLNAR